MLKGRFVGRSLGLYRRLIAGTGRRMSFNTLAVRRMERKLLREEREALRSDLLEAGVRVMRARCRWRMWAARHGSW
jgi:hypothetical protein